jgi:hypothetical protein
MSKTRKEKKTSVAADITKQAFSPPFSFLSKTPVFWVIEFGVVAVR